jgi:hypothetical protein
MTTDSPSLAPDIDLREVAAHNGALLRKVTEPATKAKRRLHYELLGASGEIAEAGHAADEAIRLGQDASREHNALANVLAEALVIANRLAGKPSDQEK